MEAEMASQAKVKYSFKEHSRQDLTRMPPEVLGAVLRERVHHMIEVPLYPTLLRWKGKPIKGFGAQAELVFDVWQQRGLPLDRPDIRWAKQYIEIAEKIREGEKPNLDVMVPEPFTPTEMQVVRKLLYTRRSVRNWRDEEVPDELIETILEAGRMAPIGCNLGHLRFVVLKSPEEKELIWSDISTRDAAVIIVICHDTRVAEAVDQDTFVPQNAGFDAAAAADHMLLMAHALGLGAVWLSELKATEKSQDTGDKFKLAYGLPDYLEVDLHIAIGWPAMGSIKSLRPPLEELVIRR
jgi:nitroreductase